MAKKNKKYAIEWRGPYSNYYLCAETFPQFVLYKYRNGKNITWWVSCDALNLYDQVKGRSLATLKHAAIQRVRERLNWLAKSWNKHHPGRARCQKRPSKRPGKPGRSRAGVSI